MQEIDNKEVATRLAQIIKDQRAKSKRAFALSINSDPSFFGKILKGDKPITESVATAIAGKYGVNEDWLYYGKGDAYAKKKGAPEIEDTLKRIDASLEQLLRGQGDMLDQHSYTRAEIRGVARYLIFQDSKEDQKQVEALWEIYRKLVGGALLQDERMGSPVDVGR